MVYKGLNFLFSFTMRLSSQSDSSVVNLFRLNDVSTLSADIDCFKLS